MNENSVDAISLRERLSALAHEIDTLPRRSLVDARSDNDILSYDEHGAWLSGTRVVTEG